MATQDQVAELGVRPDGAVWLLERRGRLVFFTQKGKPIRTSNLDALCMYAELSPDGARIAVAVDLLELRSSVHVFDTATGKLELECTGGRAKAPTARGGTVTVTAKDGKLWLHGSTKALAPYRGEARIAVAKDGSQALVLDDFGVRVFDLKSRKRLIALSNAAIEEETIDEVAGISFDSRNRPCVKVGRHTYDVKAEGVRLRAPSKG